jgi:hypothetical protein
MDGSTVSCDSGSGGSRIGSRENGRLASGGLGFFLGWATTLLRRKLELYVYGEERVSWE